MSTGYTQVTVRFLKGQKDAGHEELNPHLWLEIHVIETLFAAPHSAHAI